jgi:YidC/Oxa1 family membrane protein insertase
VATPNTPSINVLLPREEILKQSPRIVIDTPKLSGSIMLQGGRIDDLSLKSYRETVDPKSANIQLLSPSGSANAFYAEFGWIAGQGAPVALPNNATVWNTDQTRLTPETPVTLSHDNGQGIVFKRKISIDSNAMFTITHTVEKTGGEPVTLYPYGLVSRHGKPPTEGFFILHEGLIGVMGEEGLQEFTYDNIAKEPNLSSTVKGKSWKDVNGGFVGITDKYWAAALIPDQSLPYEARFSTAAGSPVTYQTDVLSAPLTLTAGIPLTYTQRLFAGAKEVATIEQYEKSFNIKRFDLLIDWGWFYFITRPLFKALDWFNHLTGNFGLAILIVTVLIKLVFFPLANKSYASMAKMKAVQPQMVVIRERYADDRMKQQQELMELYRREKINPLAGCWPVLIQIPVFFALYKVLFVTIEMRHAPFYGWIRDLAAPDPTSIFNLFGLLPFSTPAFLTVGIWPILMGITMFVQMKMNPEPTDPIQKTMFTWMPLLFTFMLAAFPAGLVIYWTWNNLLSILQQGYIMKQQGTRIELWDNIKGMFVKKA